MVFQTVKQSRCCSQLLEAAASCVHGQSRLVDELLNWTSDTLSQMTSSFNAKLPDDLKLADTQLKQHNVSRCVYS